MFKKIISFVLVAILTVAMLPTHLGVQVQAATRSRTISVFRVEGRNSTIYRNNGQTSRASRNFRLSSGDALETGFATNLYLRMDMESLLKMDSNSYVSVEMDTNMLNLTVDRGIALVDVAEHHDGQETILNIGSVSLTVRGTMFTIGHGTDYVFIAMLSGSGEVDDIILESGQILTAFHYTDIGNVNIAGQIINEWTDQDTATNVAISTIQLEDLNYFTLNSILDNQDYLLENSDFVDEQILEMIPPLLEEIRESESQETARPGQIANVTPEQGENGLPAPVPVSPNLPNLPNNTPRPVNTPRPQITPEPESTPQPPLETPNPLPTPGPTITPPPTSPTPEPPTSPTPTPGATITPLPTTTPDPTPTTTPLPIPFPGTGSGTESDPYIIVTVEHLKWLNVEQIPTARATALPLDFHFKLGTDIVIPPNSDFEGILQPFRGVFDGDGNSISNFSSTTLTANSRQYRGFFYQLKNAEIKNLSLVNVNLSSYSDYVNGISLGGLAGEALDSTIANILITGTIYSETDYSALGGIVGSGNNINLKNIHFSGNITGTNGRIGGIVGNTDHNVLSSLGRTTIENAIVDAIIIGAGGVGGITGGSSYTDINNVFTVGSLHSNDISNVTPGYGSSVAGIVAFTATDGITDTLFTTINNAVALQSEISSNDKANQIFNNHSSFYGRATNSFARNDMLITLPPHTTPSPNFDGTPVSLAQLQTKSWWEDTLGFDFTIWQWNATPNEPYAMPTLQSLHFANNNVPIPQISFDTSGARNFNSADFTDFTMPNVELEPQTETEPPQQGEDDEFWDINLDDLLTLTPEVGIGEDGEIIITIPEFPTIDIDEENESQQNTEDELTNINLDDLLTLTPEVDVIEPNEPSEPIEPEEDNLANINLDDLLTLTPNVDPIDKIEPNDELDEDNENTEDDLANINLDDLLTLTPEIAPIDKIEPTENLEKPSET